MKTKDRVTLFGLPADYLAYVPTPTTVVLSPDHVEKYYNVNFDIVSVRNMAARSIRKIRRRQRQLAITQQRKRIEENAAHMQRLVSENEIERQKLLAETVQWAVEERDIEQQLYLAAMQKAQQWAIEALHQWGIEADWDEALCARVNTMLKQFEKEPHLVLALPSEKLANTFGQRLSANADDSQCIFKIVVDSTLKSWQARLGNALVSVLIDMHEELDDILTQLRNQPVASITKAVEDYEQD
ncbi:TPA: hypothetical protein ACH1J3_002896 [Citrobacter werkmanii]